MKIFKSKVLKKALACFLACLTAFSVATTIACAPDDVLDYEGTTEQEKEVDASKTQLYVGNFYGGIGQVWLDNVIDRFEKEYATHSFGNDKKGVQVHVSEPGSPVFADISNDSSHVYFFQAIDNVSLASRGQLLDLTEIVTESLSDITNGKETTTIESRLSEDQKKGMKAVNGKYYTLPHYEIYDGIVYDIDTFEDYGLYILEGNGSKTEFSTPEAFVDGVYVGTGKLSVGPDGVRGTTDDGQPSSYEEFFALMDRMVTKGVTPFVYSGGNYNYLRLLFQAAWSSWEGYDKMRLHYTLDSGEEQIKTDTITGWNGDTPIVTEELITPETAYKLYQQEGKYRALTLLEKMFAKPEYQLSKINGTYKMLDAQEDFILGYLENKPIGMLIEGNYWYNEAAGARERAEKGYGDKATNRRFSLMELPRQATGQVTEGNGTKNTLHSTYNAQAFINANVSNNAEIKAAALEFLQYCYTEESLQNFTVDTGVFRGLNYTLTKEQSDSLYIFAKNVEKVRIKSDVLLPDTDCRIYLNNMKKLDLFLGNKFTTVIDNVQYDIPHDPFVQGYTARQYFDGSKMSEATWLGEYCR